MGQEKERPDTDGPGNVSVDEPTAPAMDDEDQDEFDEQAETQTDSD